MNCFWACYTRDPFIGNDFEWTKLKVGGDFEWTKLKVGDNLSIASFPSSVVREKYNKYNTITSCCVIIVSFCSMPIFLNIYGCHLFTFLSNHSTNTYTWHDSNCVLFHGNLTPLKCTNAMYQFCFFLKSWPFELTNPNRSNNRSNRQ